MSKPQKLTECWVVFCDRCDGTMPCVVSFGFPDQETVDRISKRCREVFPEREYTTVRMLPAVSVKSAIRAACVRLSQQHEEIGSFSAADAEWMILDAINQEVQQ